MNQRTVLKFMFKTLECTTKIHFGANELPTIGSFEGDAGHPKTEGAMRLAVAWCPASALVRQIGPVEEGGHVYASVLSPDLSRKRRSGQQAN
jgi:hypothetical protein